MLRKLKWFSVYKVQLQSGKNTNTSVEKQAKDKDDSQKKKT